MTINQGSDKLLRSQSLISKAIENKSFFISPLVMSEYIHILSKLKILDAHANKINIFAQFVSSDMDKEVVLEAYTLCKKVDFCKNINDAIHLKIAEKYCTKLITFDSDFKKLQDYTSIEIEIL